MRFHAKEGLIDSETSSATTTSARPLGNYFHRTVYNNLKAIELTDTGTSYPSRKNYIPAWLRVAKGTRTRDINIKVETRADLEAKRRVL